MHRYTGSEPRVYPYARMNGHATALEATPGMDPVEFDEPPGDGRWEQLTEDLPEEGPQTAPAKKAAPPTAKAVEE